MPRKFRQELPEVEILRDRALRCRRLADGVGDLAFAIKLHALSEEYECEAKRTEAGGRIGWRDYTDHPENNDHKVEKKAVASADGLSHFECRLLARLRRVNRLGIWQFCREDQKSG